MAEITPKGVDSYPGGKDKYRDDIAGLVRDIMGNPVGWVILTAIIRTPKQLTIWPESERQAASYDRNLIYTGTGAGSAPVAPDGKPGYAGAAPRGVSRKGKDLRDKWYAGRNDNPETEDIDERQDPAPASWGDAQGGGSDARIFFTPGGKNELACSKGYGTCAELDDEILLHELVHALRMMQGVWNPVPTRLRYKNEEEFLALVITNVYISRKTGNHLLRPDYQKVGPLQPPWNTSDGFLKDEENETILKHYATAWQPVFGQLGEVETAFNPFRPFKTSRKP